MINILIRMRAERFKKCTLKNEIRGTKKRERERERERERKRERAKEREKYTYRI